MANYLGDFAEDTADITFAWDSNDGDGASVTRTVDGTVYVQKVGALASSSTTAATVTKANPGVVTDTAHGLENGDEMFFYNMTEMTELNQTIGVAANKADDTFEIASTAGYGAAETTGGAWIQVNTAEVTDTEDYKGVTGSHLCVIDTSGDDYFEAGADYIVYLNAATIDGQVVNVALAMFSIENRFAEVDVVKVSGDATAADNLELMYDGTGYAGGTIVLQSDMTKIHGTAITETATQLAGAFTKFFDVATPTGTVNSIPDAVAGAAGGLFIAGTNAATAVTTAFTTNIIGDITGALSGAVGSVTGAVGSVGAGGIVAATFGADAITNATIADNAIAVENIKDAAITAAKLGADCITNAKIADDAIAAENLKTGAISADAFAADAIVAATLATGALTADAFAADALVAATFATDSIAADALKADAVTEIVTAILAGTADGVALSDILTRLNALAKGKIQRTTDTSVYKKEDGTTTAFTNVIATGGRNL